MVIHKSLRSRLRSNEESGFSLVELIVAMGIFIVFISIFMASVTTLARGTSKAQVTAEASTGVMVVFQTLDRQIRYADTVNVAGPSTGGSGARYIEFRTLKPVTGAADVLTCTQWRYLPTEARIEMREWLEASPATTTTSWSTKLTNVVDEGGAGYPFTMIPANFTTTKQQLKLRLTAGTEGIDATATVDTTFVARNSSSSSVSNSNPLSKVCDRTGLRP